MSRKPAPSRLKLKAALSALPTSAFARVPVSAGEHQREESGYAHSSVNPPHGLPFWLAWNCPARLAPQEARAEHPTIAAVISIREPHPIKIGAAASELCAECSVTGISLAKPGL